MTAGMAPAFHGRFPHGWRAEILPGRPMILPARHYVYPAVAEEVEKGALEVLVQPSAADLDGEKDSPGVQPFLATCALGFRDPAAPTGLWSMPDPEWICAVSGGYAYLIDTVRPERFTFLRYRPVLDVVQYLPEAAQSAADSVQSSAHASQSAADDAQSLANSGLLLFVGHYSILAWGRDGEAWESDRLSWEGVTVSRIEDGRLHGVGWDLRTDKEFPFVIDLANGKRL